jgi:hypothetical protein
MIVNGISTRHRYCSEKAYTLIELLAVIFIVTIVTAVHQAVRGKYGLAMTLVFDFMTILVCAILVILFYRWTWSRDKKQLTTLREKYRSIYQVKALPTDAKCIVKPEGAEIQIGDYAWEARPSRRDGLIHLQGLTLNWKVVWHAGFRSDQIERVADKPASQYDYWRPPYWDSPPYSATTKPSPPCPYPVQERTTPTMGLPHHSGHYFVKYPSQDYRSEKIKAG